MPWTKEDRSFKTLINKRTTSSVKAFYEEFGDFTLDIVFDEVKTDTIPINDPNTAVLNGVAELRNLFVLTEDISVPNQQSYFSEELNNRLKSWISDKYGDSYRGRLFDNNDNEIFPTDASDWFFDYSTGILTFNGSTTGFAKPFKWTGYRYIGQFGGSTGGNSQELKVQELSPLATSSSGDLLSNDALAFTPAGAVQIYINGVLADIRYDGITLNDASFVDSTNTIVRQDGQIVAGDRIRWYGNNAGFELDGTEKILLYYL